MITGSVRRDENRIPTWWGLSSVDGMTLVPITVNASTGKVKMEIGTSVSAVIANLPSTMPRDENRIPCVCGVSSTDGTTLIPLSVDPSTGAILAQTA